MLPRRVLITYNGINFGDIHICENIVGIKLQSTRKVSNSVWIIPLLHVYQTNVVMCCGEYWVQTKGLHIFFNSLKGQTQLVFSIAVIEVKKFLAGIDFFRTLEIFIGCLKVL